ncbi:filamentous hemagglutinin family protein [Methylomonas sp. HW2-6]|uniref:filamentous haemagglutinin family protein n=1 Tax=Methylomonas sp. HW2-6 TaxID=3376687 RepID=UPI004042C975
MAKSAAFPRQTSCEPFRLNPLVACVRLALTGGMLVGSASAAWADTGLPIPAATWVTSGAATNQIIGNTLRIDQTTDKAILNWDKFNVDAGKTVQFVQPNSQSIALNRINQQDPSRIFGQIIANGQIYLYNKNGFVFGKDAVINTNTVVATTLNISDEIFKRGITKVFDENNIAALAIEPMGPGDTLDPKTAQILIEAGAKISTDNNGRIIIVAPEIENRGELTGGKQGQIILAASQDKVYLQTANEKDPFAGLIVEVDTGGKVKNATTGNIGVRQGNVTMAGFVVNQEGRISATTSVNVNGSIRLQAAEQSSVRSQRLVATSTERTSDADGLGTKATVTFGSESHTEILADAEGGSAVDSQVQPNSYLAATANTVVVEGGAHLKVPGGKVNLTATDNLLTPNLGTKGSIRIDSGAVIDASGYKNVAVAMERNLGEVSVQTYDLRDAPLQKSGVLKGKTVYVDLRGDTKIVDSKGAKDRISRSIQERLAKGGSITLTSGGDIAVNGDAKFDISGGSVNYADGYVNTTKLMNEYGQIVDIGDADPNDRYVAVLGVVNETHRKWGVEKAYNVLGAGSFAQFERGYSEGKSAGSLNLQTAQLAWNGDLTAGSQAGLYQRDLAKLPGAGEFKIDLALRQSGQNVKFQTTPGTTQVSADQIFPLKADGRPVDLVISTTKLEQSGVGKVSVKTLGSATVGADVSFAMRPTGSLNLSAGIVDFAGDFKAAGGSISLTASSNDILPGSGDLLLADTANLDVSGLWVNDLQKGFDASPTDALALDGGKVTLNSEGNLTVAAGSRIRADGGAWLALSGDIKAGKGGDITLAADANGPREPLLRVAGEVSAYGLEQNGSLTLESNKIVVGTPAAGEADQVFSIGTDGFDTANFAAFNTVNLIANTGAVTVKASTDLDLRARNLVLAGDYLNRTTGSALRDFSQVVELPEHMRQPMAVTLKGLTEVVLETGSTIRADKGSTVSLVSSEGSIYVDGTVQSQGGKINLTVAAVKEREYDDKQVIWLGSHGKLLAQGTSRLNPADVFGRRTGVVLDGGEVVFDALRGAVVLESGSLIDVSGTGAELDIPQKGNPNSFVRQQIASNAGKVKVAAAEGGVLEADFRANAGSPLAHAGKLELALDRLRRNPPDTPTIPFPSDPLVIHVSQTARRSGNRELVYGEPLLSELNEQMSFSVDRFAAGGFSDLSLMADQVEFDGSVELQAGERIKIDAAKVSAVGIDGQAADVKLNTMFLQIGSSLNRALADSADTGSGRFSGNAQWIQLNGATQWNGFERIALNSQHDLRAVGIRFAERDFVGGLVTAADLYLQASQIYPSTLSNFTFAVKNNADGKIVITGNNTDTDNTPLSAAGQLTFDAPVIHQAGAIKAPMGTITLKAGRELTLEQNSLTSVSARNMKFDPASQTWVAGAGLTIPFGVTQGGLDWLYPLGNTDFKLVFDTAPEKRLVLSAPDIDIKTGSTVDVAGGGDLLSYEFQPGVGGSYDYLQPGSPSYQGGFAVLPSLGSELAPFDHYESQYLPYAFGSKIYLDGGSGLAAGEYVILPARYALLPGAYLITPQVGTQDLPVSQATIDGRAIVPGYMVQAGTGIRDARSNGYLIETAADVRMRSSYDIHTANDFYRQRALKNEQAVPLLPKDSGQISLVAQNQLVMDGKFLVEAANGGRGAKMDIAANRISVVEQLSQAPVAGVLEILDSDLSALNVDSLLLGGARSRNQTKAGETDIRVTASEVVFSENVALSGPEIMAAATGLIDVHAGAVLAADRAANSGDSVLNIAGDGAILRVSGDKQVVFNRSETSTDAASGELQVAAGATLKSAKSMLLGATRSTQLLGELEMDGGSLNLTANTINLGEVDGLSGSNALNWSNRKLSTLAVDELVLTARDSIGVYGNLHRVNADCSAELDQNGNTRAIHFGSLTLNAAGIAGYGADGDLAQLSADSLTLQNSAGAKSLRTGSGNGVLALSADILKTADILKAADSPADDKGMFVIDGFSRVDANAAKEFRAAGQGTLKVAADLSLAAGMLTVDGGGRIQLDASGHDAVFTGLASEAKVAGGLGGAISAVADSIDFNAKAVLASGALELQALTGDVVIGAEADIDLAGRSVRFADQNKYTAGGSFKAIADQKRVIVQQGAVINADGGGDAQGGDIVLRAPNQSLILKGQIRANGGSAAIEVDRFDAGADFGALMAIVKNAGIDRSIDFRVHNADIKQLAGGLIAARKVTLASDNGAVNLAGSINADATDNGGEINIYAGDNITLQDGATLSAVGVGEGAKGGKVLLSAIDSDKDGTGGIAIRSGANIDVSGNGAAGGKVTLRAKRSVDGIDIQPVAGTVTGYTKFYAEGVKVYDNLALHNDGEINAADIDEIKRDTLAYMTAQTMQKVAALAPGLQLLAGVEIDYDGNLALQERWDLADWRYGNLADGNVWNDTPGRLVIKATGDFDANQSLSDGFKKEGFRFAANSVLSITDKLQGGDSWSYDIVAGAADGSADFRAVGSTGTLKIAEKTTVRTGNGDMWIGAGADIKFDAGSASVYNAGRPTESNPFGNLKARYIGQNFYTEYPVEGGDLTLAAGGSIKGAATENNFNSWLSRIGSWKEGTNHRDELPTAWGLLLGYAEGLSEDSDQVVGGSERFFQQNVGSFGGGKVTVIAGGSITNLDVMMPTTGKQVGKPNDNDRPKPNRFDTNEVQVNGGGTMQVYAGGDIVGGTYYLGKGAGNMVAGGKIGAGEAAASGPRLLVGDTRMAISAGAGVDLSGVSDPMSLHNGGVNFFSYGANSSLSVETLAGDVVLRAGGTLGGSEGVLKDIYPASLSVAAVAGNIRIADDIVLFPSPTAQLSLLAGDSISTETNTNSLQQKQLVMSDFDPRLLPTAVLPRASELFAVRSAIMGEHATEPLHAGNKQPVRLISANGNIENIIFTLPKHLLLSSGKDLVDVSLAAQHVAADTVSLIEAARDIRYSSFRSPNTGILTSNQNKIEVAGGGDVLIKAGRNIDLGASVGVSTTGNLFNTSLADRGANLHLLTGANGELDYAGFIEKIMQDDPQYAAEFDKASGVILGFMRQRLHDDTLDGVAALAAFAKLSSRDFVEIQPQLNAALLPVLFDEIKASGTASAGSSDLGNQRGFAAIDSLFAGSNWQGDLSMFFSKIHTLDHGNINILAPGGQVNVGLAVSFAGEKDESQLGIVAWREGDINVMVRDDFSVNTSRAFVLDGGDILVWSSEGNIDAGRGAKTALSIPPVEPTYDKDGNLTSEPPAIISGSGIRTAANSAGRVPGDVFLFAPKGVVDAGEAGIGGKNVFIAATAVLGAQNIQVSGVGTGVPVAATGSVAAGLTGTSNLNAGVSQMAESSVNNSVGKDNGNSIAKAILGMLSVELLGFGD